MRVVKVLLCVAVVAGVLAPGAARAERTVTITGGGYGHGIGMSQYGAYGRALNGKSASQILERYYTGAQVGQADMPGRLRVGLLPIYGGGGLTKFTFDSQSASGDGFFKIKLPGRPKALAKATSGDTLRVEISGTGGFRVYKNDTQIRRDGRRVFGSPDDPLKVVYARHGALLGISGKSYRLAYGTVEVGSYASSSCGGYCGRAVLVIPMQKYLYGLGEVPSSWPGAALRAQAIAGRTYAYEKVTRSGQNRFPCGCAVYDSTIDQAYIGDAKRTGSGTYWDAWKSAVDDTNAQVITYQGSPIQALYSSSSGGHTENNENVWGGSAIPYLRGVADGADKAAGANPNHTWTVEMPFSTFEKKLDAAYGTGSLKNFELVKPFGVSGRVTVVKSETSGGARIVGSAKTARVSGWSLRSTLGLKDSLFRVDLGVEVGARFQSKYRSLDGAPGEPVSMVYRVPKGVSDPSGWAQDFERGRMYDNGDRVMWQYGKVLTKYDSTGREKGKLAMPRTGIWSGDGFLGAAYERGRIIFNRGRGVFAIRGSFEKSFLAHGGAEGKLGRPITDRQKRESLPRDGSRQRFENGTLYRPGGKRAVFALWGPIAERYIKLGEGRSKCGYPTADAVEQPAKMTATFEHGSIVWTPLDGTQVDCHRP